MINEYQVAGDVYHTRVTKPKKTFNIKFILILVGAIILVTNLIQLISFKPFTLKMGNIPFTQYEAKEGYSFSYPAGWKIGSDANAVTIVDTVSSDYLQAVKAKWSVESNNMAAAVSPAQMRQSADNTEAESTSIIADEYTTIDGLSAFRLIKKTQPGDEQDGEKTNVTKTTVSYQLLKDNTVYRFNCEIDNNNPDELIKVCERIAKSFQIEK